MKSGELSERGLLLRELKLPRRTMAWVETQVARNHYASVEDYLVQLVEKERSAHEQLRRVRKALAEARESGVSARSAEVLLADWLNPGGAPGREARRQALAAGRASGVSPRGLERILEAALAPAEPERAAA